MGTQTKKQEINHVFNGRAIKREGWGVIAGQEGKNNFLKTFFVCLLLPLLKMTYRNIHIHVNTLMLSVRKVFLTFNWFVEIFANKAVLVLEVFAQFCIQSNYDVFRFAQQLLIKLNDCKVIMSNSESLGILKLFSFNFLLIEM